MKVAYYPVNGKQIKVRHKGADVVIPPSGYVVENAIKEFEPFVKDLKILRMEPVKEQPKFEPKPQPKPQPKVEVKEEPKPEPVKVEVKEEKEEKELAKKVLKKSE